MNTYTVGQELLFVPSFVGWLEPVKVAKVGRQWLTLDNGYRVQPDTLDVVGKRNATVVGKCCTGDAAYEREVKDAGSWIYLHRMVYGDSGQAFHGLTANGVKEVHRLLFGAMYTYN